MPNVFNNAFPNSNAGTAIPQPSGDDFGVIARMRKQFCWWFEQTGSDAYGRDTYAAAILISCRWDDNVQFDLTDKIRSTNVKAIVFTDRRVKPGDVLMLETSTNPQGAPPIDLDYRVQKYFETPNMRNTAALKKAVL